MMIKKVMVAGGGVLGSQIIFQTAFSGFDVTIYGASDASLERTRTRLQIYRDIYEKEVNATKEQIDAAYNRMSFISDLELAVKDKDLVIESLPEVLETKIDFFERLAKVAPEETIFVTNSSTLLPSTIAEHTQRPEKFLTLHFCTEIWKYNLAEIMLLPKTDEKYIDIMIEFAKGIGMVPVPIKKEQPGYIVNTLLVPMLYAALQLEYNKIASIETIDKTWMVLKGTTFGPFAHLDMIGLNTAHAITQMFGAAGDPIGNKIAEHLKADYIDKGNLGKQTGEGFYKYPNPAFESKDFLK